MCEVRGLLVGVVGKTGVGKSTFFSAVTLIPVAIASRPFTTVKPNRGVGYLRTPCVCKEFDVEDQPVNSACVKGVRLIPVEIVDCAGLIPGAWMGRGLGNQFLDEIRKADALIHVVDAAGATDEEGRPCKPGTRDPLKDVEFLDYEIAMWLTQIMKRDWRTIAQKSETYKTASVDVLSDRLSGLAIGREQMTEALKKTDLGVKKLSSWSDDDIFQFAVVLRRLAKPMLLVANKIDLPHAEENVERLRETGYPVVPGCAEAELALRRAADKGFIDYVPGDCNFDVKAGVMTDKQRAGLEVIRERLLRVWGCTGVLEALNMAFFELLQMVAVYPVEDVERLSDHYGRVLPDVYLVPFGTTVRELAYSIHSELGEGFIYALDVRSRRRLGEDYVLRGGDVVKIYSAKARA